MKICNSNQCTGCGACFSACPCGAIRMEKDEKGYFAPVVDEALCISCEKCVRVCHVNAVLAAEESKEAYAAVCNDGDMRRDSSSGGVVPAIAKSILEKKGAVVGAVFDGELRLREELSYSWEDYIRRGFSKSKYVQSETGDCFLRIKKQLDGSDAPVLFVGTPCQNAALKQFLGKNYANLFLIDFVCHGVPSQSVFESYVRYLEGKNGSKIRKISFREKKPSWSLSSVLYEFENGKKYYGNMMEDPYNVGFVSNLYLRESCYSCKYNCMERVSDLTVGDYWGKREVCFGKDDGEQGVSAVIVNSEKGRALLELCREQLTLKEVSVRSVKDGNLSLEAHQARHAQTDAFWQSFLEGKDWPYLSRQYCASLLKAYPLRTRIMMKYSYSKPFKILRSMKNRVRGRK